MKVYAVFETVPWDGSSLVGLFDTKAKAESACCELRQGPSGQEYDYAVAEIEVK